MKLKDKNTLSIAAAVSDVVEGKVKKEEAKYPHDMFHPETGEKKVAKDEAEHKALADKGYKTVEFEGSKQAIEDVKILAQHNYCEEGEFPRKLSYLRPDGT